jgi:hypothetical protein
VTYYLSCNSIVSFCNLQLTDLFFFSQMFFVKSPNCIIGRNHKHLNIQHLSLQKTVCSRFPYFYTVFSSIIHQIFYTIQTTRRFDKIRTCISNRSLVVHRVKRHYLIHFYWFNKRISATLSINSMLNQFS